ncbi:SDR family oxidoreductase [uncultured Salinisphaera sp.]|uniref:SDR family oxidoreductase n=1 Tax=Salinisphaera sp. C84B14 TaxID=1304155 RepID=UPI0032B2BA49
MKAADGQASACVTDATDEQSVVDLFDAVEAAGGHIACVIYNVGNNTPGRIHDMTASYFEQSWRTICLGGFLFGRETVRRMRAAGQRSSVPRTLIFTGASASLRGRAGYGAFNAAKGGLGNLAAALAKEHASDGIHISHVVIDGGIDGDKMDQAMPDGTKKAACEQLIDLKGIAASYWFLHQQDRRAWTFELDLRTWQEQWQWAALARRYEPPPQRLFNSHRRIHERGWRRHHVMWIKNRRARAVALLDGETCAINRLSSYAHSR